LLSRYPNSIVMRHKKKTVKLGRDHSHRNLMLANQVCSLIEHNRIQTTLAKAKALRPLAERLVTLGKRGTLHARRTALSVLGNNQRQVKAVRKLFEEIAPRSTTRPGGYTRIIKLGYRRSDAAPIAFIEWVDTPLVTDDAPIEVPTAKKAKKGTAATNPDAQSKD
jgi:large subunit ribosomal protein L17